MKTLLGSIAPALLALLASAAGAQCTFSQSAVPARLSLIYRFGLHSIADTTALGVTLEFNGSAAGVDTLSLPSQWAGQRLHAIRNLRALDGGVEIDSVPNQHWRLVNHAPGARVRLAYDLVKDWDGSFDHPFEFHPVISNEYFEMTGSNSLAHPRVDSYSPVFAAFDWTALPAPWSVATSFGADEAGRHNDRCQLYSGTLRDVDQGLYAAGDFRIHRFAIRGKSTVLAIRGDWTFSDSAVVSEIQRDVGAVRTFWHDDTFPYFLVTWAPFDRDHGSSDGTGFTNSMWIFMSKLDPLSTQITQLTHEAFHAWDPRRMGRVPTGDEASIGWFHEGFTMYYADMIAYGAGFIPLDAVVRRANHDLANFAGSSDPYTRGDVIARWLDGAIREYSRGTHSLDDMMRDMVREADHPLTVERILSTADRYLPPNDQTTLRDLATGSGAPPATLSAGALAPCVRVTLDSIRSASGSTEVVPQLHIAPCSRP